jgi:hypothetical protein
VQSIIIIIIITITVIREFWRRGFQPRRFRCGKSIASRRALRVNPSDQSSSSLGRSDDEHTWQKQSALIIKTQPQCLSAAFRSSYAATIVHVGTCAIGMKIFWL